MNTALEQIKPETLAVIEEQAKAFGLSVDEYLQNLLSQTENASAFKPSADNDEFEADMIAFADETEDLSTYNGAYSREDIYFDHN
jgi:hypothetical protein